MVGAASCLVAEGVYLSLVMCKLYLKGIVAGSAGHDDFTCTWVSAWGRYMCERWVLCCHFSMGLLAQYRTAPEIWVMTLPTKNLGLGNAVDCALLTDKKQATWTWVLCCPSTHCISLGNSPKCSASWFTYLKNLLKYQFPVEIFVRVY